MCKIGDKVKVDVNIKKLYNDSIIPTKGTEKAGGFDLYAHVVDKVYIPAHSTVKVKTGVALEVPDNAIGGIFPRSGLATKHGLRPANCVGVIDTDYRGEVIVALHNDTDFPKKIECGDRIAQLIFIPILDVKLNEVEELSETKRGDGGFGSTGN